MKPNIKELTKIDNWGSEHRHVYDLVLKQPNYINDITFYFNKETNKPDFYFLMAVGGKVGCIRTIDELVWGDGSNLREWIKNGK